jgi:antitoxin HigA-1
VIFQQNSRKMLMNNPPHPGLAVKHDCLEPLGLTVTQAAQVLGASRRLLSDLVNGHAGNSPEMAIRLDKAFGGGAETWHRLQSAYDMAEALKHADLINVQRVIEHGPAA